MAQKMVVAWTGGLRAALRVVAGGLDRLQAYAVKKAGFSPPLFSEDDLTKIGQVKDILLAKIAELKGR